MSFYKKKNSQNFKSISSSFGQFLRVYVFVTFCVDQVRMVAFVPVVTTRLSHRYYQKAIFLCSQLFVCYCL